MAAWTNFYSQGASRRTRRIHMTGMNEKLRQQMREILLDRFEVDIEEAVFHFSTQNYVFIFPEKPYMVRVSITPKKSRGEILSELMWLDDLKEFRETVCEPSLSAHDNLLEEFDIEGTTYRASMFRKARGSIMPTTEMTPMFFICVGDLLGAIHHVSANEREIGMQYRRARLADQFGRLKAFVRERVPPDVLQRIDAVEERVNALPEALGDYGICHGDFHTNNFFVDGNNIWLFDFDGCVYANYLYDIASFISACFLSGYGAGRDLRDVLYQDLLPYFRIGYDLNKESTEEFWRNLELMLAYRSAHAYLSLCKITDCGIVDDLDSVRRFLALPITEGDVLSAMTCAQQELFAGTSACP